MSDTHRPSSPDSLVREVIARWRGGEAPDARSFLEAHPEIQQRKTLAIDLIYEEYCLRQEQGETCVASTFCNRFPAYKQSLARMLDVHQFMAGAAASPPITWPEPGTAFLEFEIIEQIGAGAVAKVFLAREIEVGGRQVVVKVSRFGRGEARLLGKLTHPGVVPIHSVRDDPLTGMTCICMPFLGTATLVDILDEAFPLGTPPVSAQIIGRLALRYLPAGMDPSAWGPVDPFLSGANYVEGIIHLGGQVATALAKAHQAGITHRDIKPSNVLLARDGRPMLLDFNLSMADHMPGDRVGGTLAYMAPEQIEAMGSSAAGAERANDPRSDLYSVGVMLFELLTGKLPSRPPERPGQTPALGEWVECRLQPPPSARAHNPAIDSSLDATLQRALAPRPIDRFQTAEELAGALKQYVSPRRRLLRGIRARRGWLLAGASLLAAGGLAGSWYIATLPPLPERLYHAGLQAFDRGDFKEAEELFTQSMKAGNDSLEVYFARGQTRRQRRDVEGEDYDFYRVIMRDTAGSGIGLIYGAQAGWDATIPMKTYSLLEQAQAAGWRTAEIENMRGIAIAKGDYPQVASDHFERILAAHPNHEVAAYNRLYCWVKRAGGTDAEEIPRKIIEDAVALAKTRPKDARAVDLAARLLSRAAQTDETLRDEARAHLERAEALGVRRQTTFLWWQMFTRDIPPEREDSSSQGPVEGAGWRETLPPADPRVDVCVRLLRESPLLPQKHGR